MRMPRAVTFTALALAIAGCSRDDPAPAPAGLATSVVSGPVTLEVEASDATIRTVDRLTVTVHAHAEPGVTLAHPAIDLAGSRWTVVSETGGVLLVDADGSSRRVRYTLEPFLDGEYELPGAAVEFTTETDAGSVVTDPLTIAVTSVLTEADTQLAAVRPALAPPAPEQTPWWVWPMVGAGVVLACLAVLGVWAWKRVRRPRTAPSAYDRLRAVGRSADVAPGDAYEAIAAAITERLGSSRPAAARSLAEECDHVRFGGAPATSSGAARAIREALSLLTPGGAA